METSGLCAKSDCLNHRTIYSVFCENHTNTRNYCIKKKCFSRAEIGLYCKYHMDEMYNNQKRSTPPVETDLWTTNWIYLFPVAVLILVLFFAFISGELGKCWG